MKLVIHGDDSDVHDYDDDEGVEGDDVDVDNGCYVYLSAHSTSLEESAEMKIADPQLGNGGKLATCSIVGMRTFYPGMETERQRRDESNKQLHLFLDPLVALVSILRASVSFIA